MRRHTIVSGSLKRTLAGRKRERGDENEEPSQHRKVLDKNGNIFCVVRKKNNELEPGALEATGLLFKSLKTRAASMVKEVIPYRSFP